MRKYFGAVADAREDGRGVSNAGHVDLGPDEEPEDFRNPPMQVERSYEEEAIGTPPDGESLEAPSRRRRLDWGSNQRCHMEGCARRLLELDFPVFYSCRTCWYTDGRKHGPECEARERAAVDE